MREFVDEGLEHEAERVGARRAQRPGRYAELHQRLAEFEMRDEPGREFIGVHRRRIGKLAALAESHEMIAQSDQPAGAVEPAFEEMKPGRTIEVMLQSSSRVHSSLTGAPTL